jgi:chromosome segregation ATPase
MQRFLILGCGIVWASGASFAQVKPSVTHPITPEEAEINQELQQITRKIDTARDKARQSKIAQEAFHELEKVRWKIGNRFHPQFEQHDNEFSRLEEQTAEIRRTLEKLTEVLTPVERRLSNDPAVKKARAEWSETKREEFRRLLPEYRDLLARQGAISAQLRSTTTHRVAPEESKIIQELEEITRKIDRAWEQARQSEPVQEAFQNLEKTRWMTGNRILAEFDTHDKRSKRLKKQIAGIRQTMDELKEILTPVVRKIHDDPEFLKYRAVWEDAQQEAFRELFPEYPNLLARRSELILRRLEIRAGIGGPAQSPRPVSQPEQTIE